ncbi:Dynein light intermediate chain [Aphelenchoides fujianensis]|nr:Dynein light intermediate chain [Aphelenchoides fujianensis]
MATLMDIAWAPSPQKSSSTQQDEEKIWSEILQSANSEASRVPQGSVIVLGENHCGKSSLITRMVGADRTPNPSVLEYNYLTIHANEDNRQTYQLTSAATTFGGQDSTNLPVYVMAGNESLAEMLEFSMPKQLSKCILLLCASFSEPVKILETLNKWYKVAEAQVQKAFSDEDISLARTEQMKAWQEYVEPAGSVYTDTVGSDFRPEFVELESGVLTETCGANVIVVLTKADDRPLLSSAEMSRLQYQIRKFCLAHGAALVYTSAKNEVNTQLLRKYIAHRVYGVPFTKTAHIVDEKTVFIPSGWDSEKKLNLEAEAIEDPDQPLAVSEENQPSGREKAVECEDEQNFLTALAKALTEAPVVSEREISKVAPTEQSANAGTSQLATYFSGLIKQTPPKGAQSSAAVDPASHFQKFAADSGKKRDPHGPPSDPDDSTSA